MSHNAWTWLRRFSIAVGVALALGYLPYHVYANSGLARYLRLAAERDALHASNVKLHRANLKLRQDLDALTDEADPGDLSRAAIEHAARDELGLVRPGEIVFKLEPRAAGATHE